MNDETESQIHTSIDSEIQVNVDFRISKWMHSVRVTDYEALHL